MIAKELEEYLGESPQEKAGYYAEKEMAFFLKKHYEMSDDVWVLNNLRFLWQGDYAQIDHLVIFKYGMVIIEDKSVSTKLKYNEHQEFFRLWDNHWNPMDNPVKQAERQKNNLFHLLQENKTDILYKFLTRPHDFAKMPIHCLVSVSQKCKAIIREYPAYDSLVMKAEVITDKIDTIIADSKKADGVFSFAFPWCFEKDEAARTKDFLLQLHAPRESIEKEIVSTLPVEVKKNRVQEEKITEKEEKIQSLSYCPECKGKVSIEWGAKYKNYYWHCCDCKKNFPINHKCPQCQQKLKVRKQKAEYHIYCEPCHLSALYFEDCPK